MVDTTIAGNLLKALDMLEQMEKEDQKRALLLGKAVADFISLPEEKQEYIRLEIDGLKWPAKT